MMYLEVLPVQYCMTTFNYTYFIEQSTVHIQVAMTAKYSYNIIAIYKTSAPDNISVN